MKCGLGRGQAHEAKDWVMASRDGKSALQAKYRDYCSARMADAIISLSPSEVYALAAAEASKEGQSMPAAYTDAVLLATRGIKARLTLPKFEEWARDYLDNPSKFDPYLIGFWKTKENAKSSQRS